MVNRLLDHASSGMTRRLLLTGVAAGASTMVLTACGTQVTLPEGTVTRVPAEGAPPTQPPAAATPAGATPAAGTPGAATPTDGATPAASPASDTGAPQAAGPLEAIDIGYVLGDLNTLNGDTVTLTMAPGSSIEFVNNGTAEHNFVVDELEMLVQPAPGATEPIEIPADAPVGEYRFYCNIPGHEAAGMVGTLVIAEGEAAAGTDSAPAAADSAAPDDAAEEAAPAGGETAVGPLDAIDIGYVLGDLNTLNGDVVTLTVAPGATFEFVNKGAAEHNFVVDALEILVQPAPGATETVTIPADAAPGEYEFYCNIPGHLAAGMKGTLVIE